MNLVLKYTSTVDGIMYFTSTSKGIFNDGFFPLRNWWHNFVIYPVSIWSGIQLDYGVHRIGWNKLELDCTTVTYSMLGLFFFTPPHWQELGGKEEKRKHISWLTSKVQVLLHCILVRHRVTLRHSPGTKIKYNIPDLRIWKAWRSQVARFGGFEDSVTQ